MHIRRYDATHTPFDEPVADSELPQKVKEALEGVKELDASKAAQNILDDVKKSRSTAQTTELNSLINELKQTNPNVKITTENVISMAKTNEGKVVWLERGVTDAEAKALGRNKGGAGLAHILEKHGNELAEKGISNIEIPDYVMTALTKGKIVGYQGSGTDRPIYEFVFRGQTRRAAVTVSDNGFIVGLNKKSIE